jgi:hypothetical protein
LTGLGAAGLLELAMPSNRNVIGKLEQIILDRHKAGKMSLEDAKRWGGYLDKYVSPAAVTVGGTTGALAGKLIPPKSKEKA